MTTKLEKLGLALQDCGAFKDSAHFTAIQRPTGESGFELKMHEKNPAAPLSPFYLMLRTADNPGKPGPLTPDVVSQCIQAMASLAAQEGIEFDWLVGVPNAGVPFVGVGWRSQFPHYAGVLRLQKAVAGTQRQIVGPVEGPYSKGARVLLVDDLITAADTKLEAIEVLREAGLQVTDLVVIVDRQDRRKIGEQKLKEVGVQLHALFTIDELLMLYRDAGCITPELYGEIMEYIDPPLHFS